MYTLVHDQSTHCIFSFLSTLAKPLYTSVGCWRDTGNRAIATLEGKDSRLVGPYQRRKDSIEKCYEAAKAKGYQYFAVQNGGWCASSANAESTYKKYGSSGACRNGKGGGWANDVYMIEGKKYFQEGLLLLMTWL